jgi:NAD(P)-dependent dehydrogenase (short-subunit alcohol dehydrogenase family)
VTTVFGGWHSYRAAKAALNQIVHGAAIEFGRTHREAVIAALHPGDGGHRVHRRLRGQAGKVTPPEAAREPLRRDRSLTPEQSGGFFDYAGREIAW